MSVLLLGLSHKTAPLQVREGLAFEEGVCGKLASELTERPGISEAMVVSTCNRVEFLVKGDPGYDPEAQIHAFLHGKPHVALSDAAPFFYRYLDREAIRHLFRVASGLDSMVIGEPQILGQVKDAYAAARDAGAMRGRLDAIVNSAFRAARRVRNETGIGQLAVSISYMAVELARKIFGELGGLSILLIGAGKMSELSAKHLQKSGVDRIYVANRTYEHAVELARGFAAQAVSFDRLLEILQQVDIVISSTGARDFILTKKTAQGVIAARKNRPIFLVDIAVPRDIDPQINSIDNMFVYDIDDLRQVADSNLRERRRHADLAERIVQEEVEKTMHRLKTNEVGPTIVSLQSELDALRRAEIHRHRSKLRGLTPEQERAVDAMTRGLVNKIAHPPISEMKKLAGNPDGLHFVEFVKRAFNLKK